MKVHLGSIVRSYAGGEEETQASGATLRAALDDLEARHPGLRFRIVDEQDQIRRHVAIFVGERRATTLSEKIAKGERRPSRVNYEEPEVPPPAVEELPFVVTETEPPPPPPMTST